MKKNLILYVFFVSQCIGLSFAYSDSSNHSNVPKIIKIAAAHGPIEIVLQPLRQFKKEVEEKTKGNILVEIVVDPNVNDNNLEVEKNVIRKMAKNEYQMSQILARTFAKYDPDFRGLEAPFLFRDHMHAFAAVDGAIGKKLLENLEKSSPFKGLAFTYSGGYRFIATKTKKLEKIEDFKNMNLAAGTVTSALILKKLGVLDAGKLTKGQVLEKLKNNSIEGVVTVFPRYQFNNEYLIAKVVNDIEFNIQFTILTINKEFFQTLTSDEQKIIEDSIQKIALLERQIAIQSATDILTNPKKFGIEINRLSDTELTKMVNVFKNYDWTKELNLSKDFIDNIQKINSGKISDL